MTRIKKASIRSSPIIHVTIRKKPRSQSQQSFSIRDSEKQTNSFISQRYESTKTIQQRTKNLFVSGKVESIDKNGITNDYHRRTKKKKHRRLTRCCYILVAAVLTLILAFSLIIPLLLLKSKSKIVQHNKTAALRWNTTGLLVTGTVGVAGNASDQLRNPYDILVDHAYNIYVADHVNHRIQKYRFGNTTGQTVAGNGSAGSAPFQIQNPSQIIFDSNENLIISQYYQNEVVFWQNGGNSGIRIAGNGTLGTGNSQLYNPCGLAFHPTTGALYIAEYTNHRIMVYAKGANSGTLVFGGQGSGTNKTQLSGPTSLYFDAQSNSLLIVNNIANNILRYVVDEKEWTLVTGDASGNSGITPPFLLHPMKAILDPMGNMYVADRGSHRVLFFGLNEKNGSTIAGVTNTTGVLPTYLNGPRSVGLDNQLNLYVVEESNHRVQKFLRY